MLLASIYATTSILHYTIDQCHTQNIVVIDIMGQMSSCQQQQTCHHTGVHLCIMLDIDQSTLSRNIKMKLFIKYFVGLI